MSDKTDVLLKHLLSDCEGYLDPYQVSVLESGGPLWPDATIQQAQLYHLYGSLVKKYNDAERPSKTACNAALEKFLASDDLCREWRFSPVDTKDEVLYGTVKAVLYDFWYRDGFSLFGSFDELFFAGRLGPGMNRSARAADLYTKLWDSPLTCTSPSLRFLWEKLCSGDPRWEEAERLRLSRYGTSVVGGNALSFVNKNVTVARTICTEPTINMWFQLGVGRFLEERLHEFFGVDIRRQAEVNGYLACAGSRDGSFATIDLESASDSVSLSLCKEILPAPMLEWLLRFRSPTTLLPDGSERYLGMMSSMGNGFTFPLQTAIFSAVVAATYKVLGIKLRKHGCAKDRNFGVFGDDIIVETRAARTVIHVLKLLGFRVNAAKTFVEGPFRESCGQDYFNGHWCRGIYIRRLRAPQDAYTAINGLNRWTARTGIPLRSLVCHLYRWIHKRDRYLVPPDENDDAGIHVPLDKVRGIYKCLPFGLMPYRYSAARPTYVSFNDELVSEGPVGERPRQYNAFGLHLYLLYSGTARRLA